VTARRLRDVISHFKLSDSGTVEHATALRKTTSSMSILRHAAQPMGLVVNGGIAKKTKWAEF
jgi:hypothetical protein